MEQRKVMFGSNQIWMCLNQFEINQTYLNPAGPRVSVLSLLSLPVGLTPSWSRPSASHSPSHLLSLYSWAPPSRPPHSSTPPLSLSLFSFPMPITRNHEQLTEWPTHWRKGLAPNESLARAAKSQRQPTPKTKIYWRIRSRLRGIWWGESLLLVSPLGNLIAARTSRPTSS
jgi:hypothetical protein